jgi:hypothetical protein
MAAHLESQFAALSGAFPSLQPQRIAEVLQLHHGDANAAAASLLQVRWPPPLLPTPAA